MRISLEKVFTGFECKALGADDAAALYNLYQTNPEYCAQLAAQPTQESLAADLTAAAEDRYTLGFYWFNGMMLAALDMQAKSPEEDAVINLVMVNRRFQTTGFGTKIVQNLISALRGEGYSRLCIRCAAENANGLRFCRRNGFRPVGEDAGVVILQRNL